MSSEKPAKKRRTIAPDAGMSLRAYAKHRRDAGLSGGTLAAVQKALAQRRISILPGGGIDATLADAEWGANTEPAANAGETKPAAGGGHGPDSDAAGGHDDDVLSFSDARARKEAALARKHELDLAKMRGELVDAADVQRAQAEKDRAVRDRFLSMVDRLADPLAAATDAMRVHELLTAEIRHVLTALSDDFDRDGAA